MNDFSLMDATGCGVALYSNNGISRSHDWFSTGFASLFSDSQTQLSNNNSQLYANVAPGPYSLTSACHDKAEEDTRTVSRRKPIGTSPIGRRRRHHHQGPRSCSRQRKQQHQCPLCPPLPPKTFSSANDLERHSRSVHEVFVPGDIYWMCNQPGCRVPHKRWPRRDNFITHLRKMHRFGAKESKAVADSCAQKFEAEEDQAEDWTLLEIGKLHQPDAREVSRWFHSTRQAHSLGDEFTDWMTGWIDRTLGKLEAPSHHHATPSEAGFGDEPSSWTKGLPRAYSATPSSGIELVTWRSASVSEIDAEAVDFDAISDWQPLSVFGYTP